MSIQKKINIAITIVLTIGFVALGIFVFSSSYLRLHEACLDIGSSAQYYFCELFEISHDITPTVTEYSKVFVQETISLPQDYTGLQTETVSYFALLFSSENLTSYIASAGSAVKLLVLLLPCIVLIFMLIKRLYMRTNTKHNKDTVPLRAFKRAASVVYHPAKKFTAQYIAFLRRYSWVWKAWIVLWALNLNLASITIAFLAYYFYFAVSFDLTTIYVQVIKFVTDLQILFKVFPWWSLVIVGWLLFDRFRKRVAQRRLHHYEARNCGFINELPIVSITCGSMGKKKTTMITDMALSQEVMFRQKALDILQKADMKFPYFPWICFEKELRKCIECDTVYNLATAKEWVRKKRMRVESHGNADLQLYRYDYAKYGLQYDDALKISNLFEILETYAQAYLIYVVVSSLIVSNYSVRTDNTFADTGNFPLWFSDFFPKGHKDASRHAHILDFDTLRLGKKVIENNPRAGSFEFGVVAISEIGKERGNNLELKEVKKSTEDTNQKNDLFNSWLKMCRHSATVDNFPFIKVFTDEQRPESWGADARDLCDIIHITASSEQKLVLPFYTIEDMLSEWAFNKFINLYYDFRFRRGDNTLLVHILKSVTAWVFRRNMRIHNRYGYSTLKIEKERGTMDEKPAKKVYYIINRKIYSRRFTTDCFSDYFNELAKKSKVGLNDYMEYLTERATVSELKQQNSYFINALYAGKDTAPQDKVSTKL